MPMEGIVHQALNWIINLCVSICIMYFVQSSVKKVMTDVFFAASLPLCSKIKRNLSNIDGRGSIFQCMPLIC